MRTAPPPRLPIFRSDGQARLLARLFIGSPEPMSLAELQRATGLSPGAVHKEVERLEAAGIVTSERRGRARLVRANQDSPFYPDLTSLITKAFGPPSLLVEVLRAIEGIEEAFVFGSWATTGGAMQRPAADVDVMVIGDPDPDEVYEAMRRVEAKVGMPINQTILSRAEWEAGTSGFIMTVREGPRVDVIDG